MAYNGDSLSNVAILSSTFISNALYGKKKTNIAIHVYFVHGTLFTVGLVCDICLGIKGLV